MISEYECLLQSGALTACTVYTYIAAKYVRRLVLNGVETVVWTHIMIIILFVNIFQSSHWRVNLYYDYYGFGLSAGGVGGRKKINSYNIISHTHTHVSTDALVKILYYYSYNIALSRCIMLALLGARF